jgi:nucleoside-diphosphate-sugar epimerase
MEYQPMKIIITGVTGLLGSYLARAFSDKGELFGLKRPTSDQRLLGELADQITWYEGDINDLSLLEEAFRDKDLVIHAAGLVSFDEKDNEKLLMTNTQGTTNVVNAMLSSGGGHLVYISSVAALGRDHEHLRLNENSKWSNSELNTPYAISKHLAELEVWRGSQEGLNVMVFNPSVLLGKISDVRSSAGIYKYVLEGNKYYPKGSINYVDIRDAVEIMACLVEKGRWNERYIINKECISYKLFFEKMAEVFDKKAPSKPLNGMMSSLAVGWVKLYNLFGSRPIALNRQMLQLAQLKISYDNQKIQQILDHRFIPVTDTFRWAIAGQ